MRHIVKRRGHSEVFDEKKVYGSVYSACLNVPINHEKAEKIAEIVCKNIKRWISRKTVVTSDMIFKETTKILRKNNRKAAFMYENHRDIN